ncbi:MAG: ABC transporter permease [Candidatus Woesearchaeota archaeon]
MRKLFKIIQKNIRLLLKSKSSAMIVVLGPLLIIFLAGIAFNNSNTYRINVGMYSSNYTSDVISFTSALSDAQFRTLKFESEQKCIDAIRQGIIHTCIVFPQDFKISSNASTELIFYVDYSKVNLVWMVRDTLLSKISEQSTELSQSMVSSMLGRVQTALNELNSRKTILTDLSTKTGQTQQQLIAVNASLNKLDLSLDTKSFNLAYVRARMEELNSQGLSAISTALDALSKINSSTDNETIKDIASSAYSSIYSMKNSFAESNSTEISTLMASVEAKLNETKQKLDAALATRQNVSKQLTLSKELLESSLKQVALLQSSFNSISDNLRYVLGQNPEAVSSPIITTVKPVTIKSYLGYMFPILLAMLTMFISIIFATTIVITDKRSNADFRNRISPTSEELFTTSAYLTTIFLTTIQLAIVLIISLIFFKAQILRMLPSLFILFLEIASMFILMGILIGMLFNSEETATLGAISVASIFLLLSSVVLPLESMPSYVMRIASYNPFILSETLLRRLIIFETPISTIGGEALIILAYIAFLVLIIELVTILRRRRFLKEPQKPHNLKIEPNASEDDSASSNPELNSSVLSATTLSDMIRLLERMDSAEFARHNSKEFADWARLNLHDEELANRLSGLRTKQELLSEFRAAYERHIQRIRELKSRIEEKRKLMGSRR